MGGRFHRATPVAGVEHLPEEALEVDRLGGGAHGRAALTADAVLDRSEKAGPSAGSGEDREEEERGGRLAIRAGDARDLELAGRMAEEGVRGESHRLAGVLDDELWNGQVELALDDEDGGAVGDGVGREVVPVGLEAGDADEERPGGHPPRVVGQVGDVDRGGVGGAAGADRRGQELEVDGSRF